MKAFPNEGDVESAKSQRGHVAENGSDFFQLIKNAILLQPGSSKPAEGRQAVVL